MKKLIVTEESYSPEIEKWTGREICRTSQIDCYHLVNIKPNDVILGELNKDSDIYAIPESIKIFPKFDERFKAFCRTEVPFDCPLWDWEKLTVSEIKATSEFNMDFEGIFMTDAQFIQDKEKFKTLMELGANINHDDGDGPAINYLAMTNNLTPEVLTMWLDAGADPTIEDMFGNDTIDWLEDNVQPELIAIAKKYLN